MSEAQQNLAAESGVAHPPVAADTAAFQGQIVHSTTAPANGHAGEVPKGEIFNHLFSELGDHHGIVLFGHVADLPMILVDNGSVDVYASEHAMEAAGKYTMHKGHPVKTADKTAPGLDLSITNYIFFQWVAMALLFTILRVAVGRYKKFPKRAPFGIQNVVEALVIYIRDQVVFANIPSKKVATRLTPYFLSLFFFILTLNLFGMIPGGHTATSSLAVTGGLAIISFLIIHFTAIREAGIGTWLHHLLGGAPAWMGFIMVPIEIISLFTRPFALMVRLGANMTVGHMVLLVFMGLIFFFQSIAIAVPSVIFSVFVYFLETLVIFLQAYIFTMLTAVFVGLQLGDHVHEHHDHAHA